MESRKYWYIEAAIKIMTSHLQIKIENEDLRYLLINSFTTAFSIYEQTIRTAFESAPITRLIFQPFASKPVSPLPLALHFLNCLHTYCVFNSKEQIHLPIDVDKLLISALLVSLSLSLDCTDLPKPAWTLFDKNYTTEQLRVWNMEFLCKIHYSLTPSATDIIRIIKKYCTPDEIDQYHKELTALVAEKKLVHFDFINFLVHPNKSEPELNQPDFPFYEKIIKKKTKFISHLFAPKPVPFSYAEEVTDFMLAKHKSPSPPRSEGRTRTRDLSTPSNHVSSQRLSKSV